MPKTYIKNKGTTTFISSIPGKDCPGNDNYNKIDWDIDYDGQRADIELDINSNGKSNRLHFDLTNDDLANILNVPAFQMPLEERLIADFPLHDKEESILSTPMPIPISTATAKMPEFSMRPSELEMLIQPLRIKKIKHARPRNSHHKRQHKTQHRNPKPITLASLKRKLITPKPRTLRISLKPKSSTASSRRQRNQLTFF